MVIFNSYVKLPEGIYRKYQGDGPWTICRNRGQGDHNGLVQGKFGRKTT